MADPTEIENWLDREWEAISAAPISFIVAIIGIGFFLWFFMWFIYRSRLASKDEQARTKDETIKLLQLRIEHKPPDIQKIIEPDIETSIGVFDIATEVNEPTIKKYEKQNPVDTLAELRSEGIHKILNAPVENDDDWKNLQEYQKEWWARVESVLKDNFSTADELNFTRLGVIPLLSFPHTYNDGHAKMLREFAIQDDRLREIIDRNLRQNS